VQPQNTLFRVPEADFGTTVVVSSAVGRCQRVARRTTSADKIRVAFIRQLADHLTKQGNALLRYLGTEAAMLSLPPPAGTSQSNL
jgi:hypothetical protein